MGMAEYQGLSVDIFDEPEWTEPADITIALYIMLKRDMAGVCPMHLSSVAARCRTTVPKLRRLLKKLEDWGKIIVSKDGTHVWLKAGIYYSLYQGKFSVVQMNRVVHLLVKWQNSGLFGENFALLVTQLYASKYKLEIPYPWSETRVGGRVSANLTLPELGSVKVNPPTPHVENSGAEPKPSPAPRSDFSNRESKGSELPLPPAPVMESDNSDHEQTRGPQKLKVHIASVIKTAFANKFKQNLPDDEIVRLLNGNERFAGFQKVEILLFAISKISDKMVNPIGALIDFSRNPEKYLSKADDHDQWKRLQRGKDGVSP